MPGDDEVVGEFSLPSIIANAFVLLEGELIAAGLSRSIWRCVTIASKRSFSIFNWKVKGFYFSFFWSFGLKSEIKQRRLNINCWYGGYRMSVLLFCVLSSFIFQPQIRASQKHPQKRIYYLYSMLPHCVPCVGFSCQLYKNIYLVCINPQGLRWSLLRGILASLSLSTFNLLNKSERHTYTPNTVL